LKEEATEKEQQKKEEEKQKFEEGENSILPSDARLKSKFFGRVIALMTRQQKRK